MRRILALSSFLLIAAAGCGQAEIVNTPAKASDAKANDTAQASATAEAKAEAPVSDEEAAARAEAEAAGIHGDFFGIIVGGGGGLCIPADPNNGCPKTGGGPGRIGTEPVALPLAVAHHIE